MKIKPFISISVICFAFALHSMPEHKSSEYIMENKSHVFLIKSQMGKDTLVIGENMPMVITLTYKKAGKICLQDNKTDVTFSPVKGWEKREDNGLGKIYNGPGTVTVRSNESIAYNLNLEDHFNKIIPGKFILKYQITLYKCGKSLPIILNDSLSIFIKN